MCWRFLDKQRKYIAKCFCLVYFSNRGVSTRQDAFKYGHLSPYANYKSFWMVKLDTKYTQYVSFFLSLLLLLSFLAALPPPSFSLPPLPHTSVVAQRCNILYLLWKPQNFHFFHSILCVKIAAFLQYQLRKKY